MCNVTILYEIVVEISEFTLRYRNWSGSREELIEHGYDHLKVADLVADVMLEQKWGHKCIQQEQLCIE